MESMIIFGFVFGNIAILPMIIMKIDKYSIIVAFIFTLITPLILWVTLGIPILVWLKGGLLYLLLIVPLSIRIFQYNKKSVPILVSSFIIIGTLVTLIINDLLETEQNILNYYFSQGVVFVEVLWALVGIIGICPMIIYDRKSIPILIIIGSVVGFMMISNTDALSPDDSATSLFMFFSVMMGVLGFFSGIIGILPIIIMKIDKYTITSACMFYLIAPVTLFYISTIPLDTIVAIQGWVLGGLVYLLLSIPIAIRVAQYDKKSVPILVGSFIIIGSTVGSILDGIFWGG